MFPVLTTDSLLSTLGLGTLSDAISCEVEEERNGSYELTLEYPQGGAHADDIAMNTLIVAKPNFTDDPQPFRIYSITKDISGKIVVHAQHISYDLGGVVVSPTTMTGATCKQAGDYLVSGTSFTFKTDKTNSADFTVDVPSSARSWFGGKSGSLMGVYGTGEYHYDGYEVEFNLHRGTNRGVELRYGKNLTELTSEMDCTNLASSVVCFYEDNGTVISGTAVSTGLVGITRELAIDVSDDYDTPPSVATLTARATQYITDHNLTAPKTNITLDFVQASKLKDRVDLCDTVSIYYEALGVSAVTKCIRTVWDVLAERYTETEFGDAKTNIADTIVEVEQVAAESVTKTTMQQAIDSATEQITGNNGGYIVLHDANNDGFPDELLIMDTADISTAVKIWRFNSSGLGYSSTGYSGTYDLAITQNGAIVADFITAGTLNANVIRAGILQDALGKNSWNLDTGALTITNGSINIDTAYSTTDVIRLNNTTTIGGQLQTYTSTYSPLGLYLTKIYNGTTYTTNINADGYYVNNSAASATYPIMYIAGSGVNGAGFNAYALVNNTQKNRACLSANYYLQLYDTNDVLRQSADGGGKLYQYDANGKLRTYLEYGDIFLYNSSEKQTVHIGTYNNQHGYLYLYDGTSNTLRAWLDFSGLKFADANGTTRSEFAPNRVLIRNSSGTARAQMTEYGDLYLYDSSAVVRAKLHNTDGLAFYNSSGTQRVKLEEGGLKFYTAGGALSASYPSAFSINSYTPSFTWSNGSTAPTVNNISAVWRKLGNVVQIYMRFNIAAINGSGNGVLVISYPNGASIDYGYEPSIVTQLYADINYSPQMFVRFDSGSMFVVSGVGGNYSLPKFKTGYHSFIATLILNNEF